jgi:hypothetical protein
MRSLTVQVQPARSPGINIQRLNAAFEEIASDNLVEHHKFESGEDDGLYFNYTFDTQHALQLWELIQMHIFSREEFERHMKCASMAMCSSENGWDEYLLLFHFDPSVELDATTSL